MKNKYGKITGIYIDEQNITIRYEDGYEYKQDSLEIAGEPYGVGSEDGISYEEGTIGMIYMTRDEELPMAEKDLRDYINPNLNWLIVAILSYAECCGGEKEEKRHAQVAELLDTYRKIMNGEEVDNEKRQAFCRIIHIDLKNLNNSSRRKYNKSIDVKTEGKLGIGEFRCAKKALIECARSCSAAGIEDVKMPKESILDIIKRRFAKPKKELPSPTVKDGTGGSAKDRRKELIRSLEKKGQGEVAGEKGTLRQYNKGTEVKTTGGQEEPGEPEQ